jgi:DNA polymerase-3 subunit gamma/tau
MEKPMQTAAARPAAEAPDDWHALVEKLSGMARQLAQHCELVAREGQKVVLRLDPAHRFLQPHQDKLRDELTKLWGAPLRLEIELGAPRETPKARAEKQKRARQEQAIAAIENDAFVREVCDLFDASIDESTIKPL